MGFRDIDTVKTPDKHYCYISIPLTQQEYVDLVMMNLAINIKQQEFKLTLEPVELESFPITVLAVFKKVFEEIHKKGMEDTREIENEKKVQ